VAIRSDDDSSDGHTHTETRTAHEELPRVPAVVLGESDVAICSTTEI
jgi:hypothetical protein